MATKSKDTPIFEGLRVYGDRPDIAIVEKRLSKLNDAGAPFKILKRKSRRDGVGTYWVRSWGFTWGNDVYEVSQMRNGNMRVGSTPLWEIYYTRNDHV